MRVVARDTRIDRVMDDRIDLREARRSGRVVTVTQRAIPPLPWSGRLVLIWRFGVCRCRPVTDLTGNVAMVGCLLLRHDLFVAVCTGLMAGILDILSHERINRSGPIVSIPAKRRRYKDVSYGHKTHSYYYKENQQVFDLFRHGTILL
jgi:hypothetical protein